MAAPKLRARGSSLLAVERDQLARAQMQLERSNKELLEALQVAYDPDYKEAVQDNIVTIAKYRARIAALDEEIRRLEGGKTHMFEPEQVPVEGEPSGMAQQQQQQQLEEEEGDAGPRVLKTDDDDMQRQSEEASAAPMDEEQQQVSPAQRQHDAAAAPGASSLNAAGQVQGAVIVGKAGAATAMQDMRIDDQAADDQGMWM